MVKNHITRRSNGFRNIGTFAAKIRSKVANITPPVSAAFIFFSMKPEDKSEVIKKCKKGVLIRNFSGQLTYEIPDYLYEQYKPAKKKIAKEFGLFPFGFTVNGSDEAFQTFVKGSKRIGIEWDVWSGLIFVAKNEQSETLITDIAEFCQNNEI